MTADGPDRGIVLACTGAGYLPLAIVTARSAAETNPDLPIDLFTDRPCDDAVFARVHRLERIWFRPKFEAMRRSRFARTLYLDTDLRVLAPVGDALDLLDRCDIAGAHDAFRNSRKAHDPTLPAAFPQVNSGVLAVRRSDATAAFLRGVEDALHASGARKDQPILRRHLWASDLRLAILPEEYNLMAWRHAMLWSDRYAAPRIVHNSAFSRLGAAPLDALTGRRLARHMRALIAADRALNPGARPRRILAPADRSPNGALRALLAKLARALRERAGRPH